MRRLVVSLAVLLALFVGADRVAVSVAEGVVASELRQAGGLTSDPSVDIAGFPFLTQAVAGRYDRIDLSATSLSRGGVRVARLDATLFGTELGLSDALGGSVPAVPVERVTARALLAYDDIAASAALTGARLAFVPGGVRVTGRLVVQGRTVTASTVSTVRLERGIVVITARSATVEGSSVVLSRAQAAALDLRVRVGTLPFGLALTGVSATPEGLVVTATAGATVLSDPR